MIFINFKTYKEGTGSGAIDLAKVMEEVAVETQIKIIPVVQAVNILETVQSTKLEVWTQHVDPVVYGAHTGSILPESVKEEGATGTFLNHSEKKFSGVDEVEKIIQRAHDSGLKTLVFAGDIEELKDIVKLKPTFVSYEPPELVGSETTSVSREKPDIIAKAVEVANESDLPLIVGAGIKTKEDVSVSLKLGAAGIAVASGVVKAKDQKQALLELASAFQAI